MPRSLWTGSLSFGLVNVPVQLLSAVRDLDLHFRQLHEKDKAPVETQRWCSEEGKEVPYEAITRSYELDNGKTVIVTDEDLEAVEPRKTRTIDIEQFVDLAEVDPIYFDHPYWLVPAGDDEGATRAYKLLLGVMEQTDHAALGRVRHARQGAPRDRARPRRRAVADDDALPRRGALDEGRAEPDGQDDEAEQGGARQARSR